MVFDKRKGLPLLFGTPAIIIALGLGCTAQENTEPEQETTPASPFACNVEQESPYDSGTPYLGIHADPGNSDVVSCTTANAFEEVWHVLKGHAIPQPNTFSPNNETTYVTAFPNADDPCTLFALNTTTGETLWCKDLPRSIAGGSVEVDEDGHLYVVADAMVYSFESDGTTRWQRPLDGADGNNQAFRTFGLHFTQGGYIATVALPGVVFLLDRSDGSIVTEFDIAEEYNFVPPQPRLPDSFDLMNLFPEPSVGDFITAFGSRDAANTTLGNFLGVSGNFTDNTIGISLRDELYVQSGGPTSEDGTIVQLTIQETDDGVRLQKGWYVLASGGSAASPSISKNGRFMVMSDGAATSTALSQGGGDAFVLLVDIESCNANADADPSPEICLPSQSATLSRGAMAGAPPIGDDGTVYYWESGLDFASHYEKSDLFTLSADGTTRSTQFADGYDWSSVMTVSNNHLIGTMSRFTESDQELVTNVLPGNAVHQLVLVDRSSLETLWTTPLTDDSTSTITIDRGGNLYVTLFGLLNIIAVNERPTLGLVKYRPVEDATANVQ